MFKFWRRVYVLVEEPYAQSDNDFEDLLVKITKILHEIFPLNATGEIIVSEEIMEKTCTSVNIEEITETVTLEEHDSLSSISLLPQEILDFLKVRKSRHQLLSVFNANTDVTSML